MAAAEDRPTPAAASGEVDSRVEQFARGGDLGAVAAILNRERHAILANWLVCLGVWMAVRIKSESARLLMIWWCMFTFITSGYEHSIANMCGLMLGLLLPHPDSVTWAGYGYNLGLSTFGNIIGGALFVAGMYWLGSPKARAQTVLENASADDNGVVPGPALVDLRR